MLKNISNLGSVLNKSEQKKINGGDGSLGYHQALVEYFKSVMNGAPCPTYHSCFSITPTGCTDFCMQEPPENP